MQLLSRFALVFALGGSAAGGLVWQKHERLPDGSVLPGVRVDGEVVTDETVDAVAKAHADALGAREVDLVIDGEAKPLAHVSLASLGVTANAEGAVRAARAFGHDEDVLTAMEAADRAKNGQIDVPLAIDVDALAVAAVLSPFKDAWDTPPASARLDLDKRSVIPERDGRSLDPFGTAEAVRKAARDPNAKTVTVAVAKFPPRISRDYVASLDVHAVLSEFETYFSRSGDQKRRGENIDNAASKLDGVVLAPGEVMSFNAVVGDRSEENGFQKSWEIFKGEMVEGTGGGTCQVASTLHAAAFFGGLDVLERLPHSRPSAYIPMGLDSTVVYPAVDLKLRNIHAFPVVVHAKTEGNKLKIQLLGADKPVKVSFSREVDKTVPYGRKVEEDARLSGNKVVVKQHGIKGYRIKRTRTEAFTDGRVRKEVSTDFYPPTTEIYEVPEGFDVSLLPPLPEAAPEDGSASASASAPASASASAPASASASASAPVACAGDCPSPTGDVTFVDGPGAHAPTTQQTDPAKSLVLTR